MFRRLSALSLIVLFAVAVIPANAQQATPVGNTIVVTNLKTEGPGSLRQAIADAQSGDTITFATGLAGTISLNRPPLKGDADRIIIRSSFTIFGPGSNLISIEGSLLVAPPGNVAISNLTFSNSEYPVENLRANLTIDNVVFQNNAPTFVNANYTTSKPDGTITTVNATSRIDHSLFTQNYSTIQNESGTLNIANSVFYSNGDGIANDGTVNIVNTTFQDNVGAITTGKGLVTITNSTFKNNTTFSENTFRSAVPNGIKLTNTIVDSTATIDQENNPATGANCYASSDFGKTVINRIVNGGNNLQFPGQSCGSSIPSLDPKLGVLSDNGGPTQTIPLLAGSPAIDSGNPQICASIFPNQDQRGMPRSANGKCDIGAFESSAAPIVPTSAATDF